MLLPLVLLAIQSQTLGRAGDPLLDVWPSNPPDGWTRHDQEKSEVDQKQNFLIVSQISHPTLELFLAPPSVNLHTMPIAPTVIVCPGGGYYIEAIEHEGWEIAKRLNGAGINAAVLKYRLPNRDSDKPLHKAPLQDAQRAIRLLRSHAEQYHLDPSNIGILGFSAGGHLAAINQRLSARDPVDVCSNVPHAIGKRTSGYGLRRRQLLRTEAAEQRAGSHIGFAEPCAFFAA